MRNVPILSARSVSTPLCSWCHERASIPLYSTRLSAGLVRVRANTTGEFGSETESRDDLSTRWRPGELLRTTRLARLALSTVKLH